MILYLIPKPADKLARKHRESGWRHVPFDREARKEMETLAKQLDGKGVSAIHCSDLDTKLAEVIRDTAHISNVCPDFQLRRFNVGRHHAADTADVDRIFAGLIEKWAKNPDIPIRGGDSKTSFDKRFVRSYQKLLEGKGAAALIVDVRSLSVIRDLSNNRYSGHSLAPNGNAPAMDRIYKVETKDASRPETAVEQSATGS